ncbi:hypothetical protein L3055_00525 [Corynebacterium sp. MC-02]|nr:hypothetical protein [Corynebacterium pseudokroppenstedtii]
MYDNPSFCKSKHLEVDGKPAAGLIADDGAAMFKRRLERRNCADVNAAPNVVDFENVHLVCSLHRGTLG